MEQARKRGRENPKPRAASGAAASSQAAPDTVVTPPAKLRRRRPAAPAPPAPAEPPAVPLTPASLAAAVAHLAAADARLAPLVAEHGAPTALLPDAHVDGFASLSRAIAYQQLATKAADTIFARVLAACGCAGAGSLRPAAVLGAPEGALRAAGLSGRKVEYMLDLARRFADGSLSDARMAALPGAELRAAIIEVLGLGPWTADMHLMFALGHPDVLPVGDLGVRRGVQLLYDLPALPTPAAMEALTAGWRPWRSVGSWYMWRVAEAAAAAKKKKKPAVKK